VARLKISADFQVSVLVRVAVKPPPDAKLPLRWASFWETASTKMMSEKERKTDKK